jgi:hypothetical protein
MVSSPSFFCLKHKNKKSGSVVNLSFLVLEVFPFVELRWEDEGNDDVKLRLQEVLYEAEAVLQVRASPLLVWVKLKVKAINIYKGRVQRGMSGIGAKIL